MEYVTKPTWLLRSDSFCDLWQGTSHPCPLAKRMEVTLHPSPLSLGPHVLQSTCPSAPHRAVSFLHSLGPAVFGPSAFTPCLNHANSLLVNAHFHSFPLSVHSPHKAAVSSKMQNLPCPCSIQGQILSDSSGPTRKDIQCRPERVPSPAAFPPTRATLTPALPTWSRAYEPVRLQCLPLCPTRPHLPAGSRAAASNCASD